MQTRFYIICHIKTSAGPESYGRFEIGNDRETAAKLFEKLKGDKEVNEQNMLYIELMETSNGLPININILSCTLDQLTENCRIVTKEIFTQHNLGKALF
ncbi:hypothetical protein FAM09_02930 [Niastella caeni]|uniref:Uncharacterized protein n=1 Tax=Niastella caeni TaxID=2569763 RepID=A0A4S8HZB4_9BACT|nr:hypothetical protein [Niastella caeni]THU41087.1 hypothetical protein FAM09_02930 [Niastella caeni]